MADGAGPAHLKIWITLLFLDCAMDVECKVSRSFPPDCPHLITRGRYSDRFVGKAATVVEVAIRVREESRALTTIVYCLKLLSPVSVKVVAVPALIGCPQLPWFGGLAPAEQVTRTS